MNEENKISKISLWYNFIGIVSEENKAFSNPNIWKCMLWRRTSSFLSHVRVN